MEGWPSAPRAEAGSVAPGQPEHLRVLVADGYADAADSLALLLRLWGHEVYVCRTGPEALEAALAYRPEVALLELVLGGLDGCALARRLRENEALPNLVLIAVTGLGDQAHRRLAEQAGFVLHLLKPVEPDEIHRILAALVEKRRWSRT